MGKIMRNGVLYGGSSNNSTDIRYDNSNSGLEASNI